MTLLQVTKTDEIDKIFMNGEDTREFDLIEGDLLKLYNEETSDQFFSRLYINDNIPKDNIALGENILDGLGITEGELIDVSGFNDQINDVLDIEIEYDSQDYNYEILKFDDKFRSRLIDYLSIYFFNPITNLYWPEENAQLEISFPNVESLKPPYRISPYYDEIRLKIKPKSTGIPFNAILLIDCSGSMKRRDIRFMNMENAIDNLIRLYSDDDIPHKHLVEWLQNLKPKFVLDKDKYKISRIDATYVAILMFFSQKISRGLGEKCGIILYSGKSKNFTFQDNKTIFDSTDFTNIEIINDLKNELNNPTSLSINQTLFTPAIEGLENRIREFAKVSPNPILILFLTDGRPEPKKLDPLDTIKSKVKYLMETAKTLNKQIVIYALGIGQDDQVDGNLLTEIASLGAGEYHFTKDFIELTKWFENLANNFSVCLLKTK
ncbi:hypothetical protein LCGC14_0640600 [marine sediment metagenome]|uniref:VWFA domain-containing protein n=1 Tax=marine sediment metagenome TaxID=412755 RepID=A0A0F9U7M5_9ZZZZ|nr:VWA domain-containing protein [bacterium]